MSIVLDCPTKGAMRFPWGALKSCWVGKKKVSQPVKDRVFETKVKTGGSDGV